jgi:hypothetical protein
MRFAHRYVATVLAITECLSGIRDNDTEFFHLCTK